MTLDEAIKHCENVAAKCFVERSARNHSGKCGFEHLELAAWLRELKAYKEQEPCEDAISRKEVKKIAKEMYLEVANMELDVSTISDCISYTSSKCREVLERKLQALPSVTPKQKTGEILTDYEIYTDKEGFERRVKKTTRCSLCSCDLGWNGDLLTHYCPNCGAKMEIEDI